MLDLDDKPILTEVQTLICFVSVIVVVVMVFFLPLIWWGWWCAEERVIIWAHFMLNPTSSPRWGCVTTWPTIQRCWQTGSWRRWLHFSSSAYFCVCLCLLFPSLCVWLSVCVSSVFWVSPSLVQCICIAGCLWCSLCICPCVILFNCVQLCAIVCNCVQLYSIVCNRGDGGLQELWDWTQRGHHSPKGQTDRVLFWSLLLPQHLHPHLILMMFNRTCTKPCNDLVWTQQSRRWWTYPTKSPGS